MRTRFFFSPVGFSIGSSIFSPVNFGPSIFTYFVLISVSALVSLAAELEASALGFSSDVFSLLALGSAFCDSFFLGFGSSMSIFPRTFGPLSSSFEASSTFVSGDSSFNDSTVIAGVGTSSATGASAVVSSVSPRIRSFSSFTWAVTASERFLRARSSANAVIKISYCSSVILWLRLFGISWPCLANSSTALSREMLSSFVALLNLTLLIECL